MEPNMVCYEEDNTLCVIIDKTPGSTQRKYNIIVRSNYTVDKIFKYIGTQYQYDSYDLVLHSSNHSHQLTYLNDKKDKILYDLPGFALNTKNIIILNPTGTWNSNSSINHQSMKKLDFDTELKIAIAPSSTANIATNTTTITSTITSLSPITPETMSDDDLALGASASPTETDPTTTVTIPAPPALPMYDTNGPVITDPTTTMYSRQRFYSMSRTTSGYVGLVNQAMTCYLNSLLQALYMTPEFRNALYKREFDNGKDDKIPYQLQKLFVNLQTSTKTAVETTDLTKSFGWDSTEAWQQHDIQELCRVMFDALEYKFKNTEQANLINILYMGKMIDYVKCLECQTEKSREDTFLDIPLPVRPFGSLTAYGSIEEALRAFVQPETLDDNNQYFCEKCSKKCDAHKGLKFKSFPYILTLHLKRFDFDYETLHRIKLNDKVTFPQNLNLNSFVNVTDAGTFANLQNSSSNLAQGNSYSFAENGKFDDCSTTDSGAAMEEDNCSGIATTASSSHHENELQEDDEGIDLSTSTDNRSNMSNESGPYMYELFSIMIHSGSASGGHYYAYIKEFENGEWFCFNDQTVTPITQEDIQKSFGGVSSKAYYSGIYSSNAYMLMYRQVDPKRNEKCIKSDNFPSHIRRLLDRIKNDEEKIRTNRESDSDILKPKVYFYNPKLRQFKDTKVFIERNFQLDSALESAYRLLKVQQFAPIKRCRLVAYDHTINEIICSLEDREADKIGDIINSFPSGLDFLLETREVDEEFEKYLPDGVTLKMFTIDLKTKDISGPINIRAYESHKVDGVNAVVAKKLKTSIDEIVVKVPNCYSGGKVFVAKTTRSNAANDLIQLKDLIGVIFHKLTYFYVTIPTIEKGNLEILGIPVSGKKQIQPTTTIALPTFEGSDVVDAVMMNGSITNGFSDSNYSSGSGSYLSCSTGSGSNNRCSPSIIPIPHGGGGGNNNHSTGSNSEDSSLSDGDRTLVEETHPNDINSPISSTSHSPQLSSDDLSDVEFHEHGCRRRPKNYITSDDDDDDDNDDHLDLKDPTFYFRAIEVPDSDVTDSISSSSKTSITSNSNSITNNSDNDDNNKLINPGILKTLKVYVTEQTRISSFKRLLESHVGIAAEYFQVVRKTSDQSKLDTPSSHEKVLLFKEGEQIVIELGRNPKKNERKAKIYFMRRKDLNNEIGKLPVVCEFIFKLGMPVIEAKRQLVAQLHRIDDKLYESLTVKNCRLWEKGDRNPIKILSDNQKLSNDLRSTFLVQECEKGENTSTHEDSLTIFVRRWHPSTLVLDSFQEITIDKDDEIKNKLANISDIPEDNIAYTKVNSSFPCTTISLLNINGSMSWSTSKSKLDNYPLQTSQNGNVYFYKNTSEPPKDLSHDERKEISTAEKARIDRIGGTTPSLYSPRRERALKIYLDSPPKSSRDD